MSRRRWPNLLELDLRENRLSPEGLQILSRADMPRLTTLRLSANLVDDDAVTVLTRALADRPLRHLDIDYDDLSSRGLLALLDAPIPGMMRYHVQERLGWLEAGE